MWLVLHLFLFSPCKIRPDQNPPKSYKEGSWNCCVSKNNMSYLALAVFAVEHESQSDGSLSVQLVQEHFLIRLSKLMIQTGRRSLDPGFTPFFHVTRAIGAKWTRSSSYPVIYFSFPIWQVTLFCPQRPGNWVRYSPHCGKFSSDGMDISSGCPREIMNNSMEKFPFVGPQWTTILVTLGQITCHDMLSLKDLIWR